MCTAYVSGTVAGEIQCRGLLVRGREGGLWWKLHVLLRTKLADAVLYAVVKTLYLVTHKGNRFKSKNEPTEALTK